MVSAVPLRAAETEIPCAADVAGGQQVQPNAAVTAVLDGETLRLESGEELKLAGVLAPRAPSADASGNWPPYEEAVSFLREQVTGRRVEIRASPHARDRYGRLLGQVRVFDEAGEVRWLQERLVASGHARVFALEDLGGCERALLAAEAAARQAKRGLWANEVYRVRLADDASLSGLRGTFQIVEGRVMSVAIRGPRAYLNFGSDWRRDFTAVAGEEILRAAGQAPVPSREEQMKQRRVIEAALKSFEGQRVRVRGWVRLRNGPMISLARLEDIERLEP